MHVKIENNEIIETVNNLRKRFKNTSFPRDLPDEHEGWVKVVDGEINTPPGKKINGYNIDIIDGVPTKIYEYIDLTNEEKAQALAQYRYTQENAGVDGVPTDRESRNNMTGAYIKAKENPDYTVDWKLPIGFVTLNAVQIVEMVDKIEAHVKKCFTAEKTVLDNIDNYSTIEEVKQAFDQAMGA